MIQKPKRKCWALEGYVAYPIVQSLSYVQLFVTPWTAARQAPLSSTISWVCSNSCPLSEWCHPTISSSDAPFSFCLQPLPASGSFQRSQLFTAGGQSGGASASVLPVSVQGWAPLRLTGLICLLSKGLSRFFSSTTVWRHQFLGARPPLWPSSHIHTWLLHIPCMVSSLQIVQHSKAGKVPSCRLRLNFPQRPRLFWIHAKQPTQRPGSGGCPGSNCCLRYYYAFTL